MSVEAEQLRQQIAYWQKILNYYQQMLLVLSKAQAICRIHYTATSRDYTKAESINRNHKLRGYPRSKLGFYGAYNEIITADGVSHIFRGEDEQGEACKAGKGKGYDICVTLLYEVPTEEQFRTLRRRLTELYKKGIIKKKIFPHKYFSSTECPGVILTKWIKEYNQKERSPKFDLFNKPITN